MDSKHHEEQAVHLTDSKKEAEKISWWSNVTLEPMWAGVFMSLSMSIVCFKNLALERACLVDLNYTAEMCFHSEGQEKNHIEQEVQHIVSGITVGSSLMSGITAALVLLFLGPWSDSSGRRRPLMLISISGMMTTSLVLILVQYFPNIRTVYVIYLETIGMALTGGGVMLVIAGFSHLGDICYKSGRCHTTVMGINSGFISIFMVIGGSTGGLAYRHLGYTGLFTLTFFLEMTSFLFIVFKVKDVFVENKIPSILNVRLPLEAVKCVFKKRLGHKRRNIMLMIAVTSLHTIITSIEYSIGYMYLRYKFRWDEMEYSLYLTIRNVVHVIGTFLIVNVLKHRMKLRDETIGLVGGFSQLASLLAFMFSSKGWMILACNGFGILSRGVTIAERPVLNKQITAKEQGKINSISVVMERCITTFSTPLANYVYTKTIMWFPSAFMTICCITAVVQLSCYHFVKREPEDTELITTEEKQGNEKA